MPVPVKSIGLTIHGNPPRQIPIAIFNEETRVWSVWIAYNRDMSAGTTIRLYPDGSASNDTMQPDGEWTTAPIRL